MSRMMLVWTTAAIMAATANSGCASQSQARPTPAAWSDCARARAVALLAEHSEASWPTVAAIPDEEPMQVIDLGRDPPEATADFFTHTLYLDARTNSMYIRRTGGIAGVKTTYGPLSLDGHCSPPVPQAP